MPLRPRLALVCGLAGSGKTTTALRLAAELPALRLCPDEWLDALDIDLYDPEARHRVEELQRQLALDTLRLGASVVIEWGLWTRRERDELLALGRSCGADVELRFLDVPLEELWRRIESRNESAGPGTGTAVIPYEVLAYWFERFEAPTAAELAEYAPPAG